MSDIELQGRVEFSADTEQAESQVAEMGKKGGKAFGDEFISSIKQVAGNIQSTVGAMRGGFSGIAKLIAGGFGGGGAGAGAGGGGGGANMGFWNPAWGPPPGGGGGGGAGGGGAAAGGAMATAGAAVAIVQAIKGIVDLFKDLAHALINATRQLMEFLRSLAQVSGKMAIAFAQFDVQIMLLKKQLGDALAPLTRGLLNEMVGLFRELMPAITYAIGGLIVSIRILVKSFSMAASAFNAIANSAPSRFANNLINNVLNTEGDPLASTSLIGLVPLVRSIARAAEKWLGGADKEQSVNFLSQFNDFIHQKNSAQSQEAGRLNDQLNDQVRRRTGGFQHGQMPDEVSFRLRGAN